MTRTTFAASASIFLIALATGCTKPVPVTVGPRPVVVEAPKPMTEAGGEALPGSIHAGIEADLSFRVPGKIAERRVDMGAHVAPGTVLAVLDPQDAALNLAAARAAVAAAEADLQLALAEEQRYRDLSARGFVGKSHLDIRVNTTQLASARLTNAKAQFDLAANQSRYTHLIADRAGVITEIMAEPGNVVVAGQPIVRFAADGEREVHIHVAEGKVDALRAARNIVIEIFTNPGKHYRGRVRDINPQADQATRMHLARISIIDSDEHVRLGATATVGLRAIGNTKVFLLPATALGATSQGQPAVWRIQNDKNGETVEAIEVEVIRYLDNAVAISGRISSSDRLVTAGVHQLTPGMAVQAIERARKAAL